MDKILECIGFNKPELALDAYRPRPLSSNVVNEGKPDHKHSFAVVPWDAERFGAGVTDLDPDNPMAMATYHDLWACPCGREIITSQRALI